MICYHAEKAVFSLPHDRDVIGRKSRARFESSLSCYEVVTNARHPYHVAKMFSADCDSYAIFCHMSEMLSGGYRGYVIVVTRSKRCQIMAKKLCFLHYMREMFPYTCI